MSELQMISRNTPIAIAGVPIEHAHQCDITILDHQASNEVNHVNNIEFIKWIDKASEIHLDTTGWTRPKLLDAQCMWFVARHEIDYRGEAFLDDALVLSTWVEDVRRVKSWRSTKIHALRDEPTLVCECRTLWVLVNLETKKPMPVPSSMAESLNPLSMPRLTK